MGFQVQFNVQFTSQVMNFPIAYNRYKEDKDTFKLCKSTGVRVKDPTSDLIFLRKTFLKPLSRVFFAKSCRRLIETGFSPPGFVWIGPKSITYFCKYSNLCDWEVLFTISALHR